MSAILKEWSGVNFWPLLVPLSLMELTLHQKLSQTYITEDLIDCSLLTFYRVNQVYELTQNFQFLQQGHKF